MGGICGKCITLFPEHENERCQRNSKRLNFTFEGVEDREPEGDLDFDLACGDLDERFGWPSSASNLWPDSRGLGSSRIGSRSGPTSSGSTHSSPAGLLWDAMRRE